VGGIEAELGGQKTVVMVGGLMVGTCLDIITGQPFGWAYPTTLARHDRKQRGASVSN
jgi:hypothetical protein